MKSTNSESVKESVHENQNVTCFRLSSKHGYVGSSFDSPHQTVVRI